MQFIISIIINIVASFLRLMPLSAAAMIGRLAGRVFYILDRRHRNQVYQNLKIAFADQMTLDEIKALTLKFFINLGMNFAEFLRLPQMSPEHVKKLIECDGKERFEEVMKSAKCGAVMMTAHFGNWELSPLAMSVFGFPQNLIFKTQDSASAFNKVMMKCRRDAYRSYGSCIKLYERGVGARKLLEALQNRELVGMVIDQGGKDGIPVQFLGRRTSFSSGGVRLALKTGAPIFIGGMGRKDGVYHRLLIRYFPNEAANEKDNVALYLQGIANQMAAMVREAPEQYMWMYKLWKFDPSCNVIILDDGRVGHLRQSEGVAKTISREIVQRGGSVSVKTVKVEYPGKFSQMILILCSWIGPILPMFVLVKLLKKYLKPETFQGLTAMKADIVISAGSLSAPVNYVISREHCAKNILILRPNLLPWSRFDLVILPRHDVDAKKVSGDRVVLTKGAVNLIDEDYLSLHAEKLLQRFSHLKLRDKFKIGVLLGGDTKNYVLDESAVKILVHQLKDAAEQLDADILLTTSRRTSSKVENLLARELKKYPRCQLLVIANRNNVAEAVGGILGLSDVLVVSGDSISMISESSASGKKTIVFPVKKRSTKGEEHKHNQFIDRLNTEGYILCSDLRMIACSIFDLAKNKICTRRLDDDETIRNGVLRIL
ncbi:MAG: ELM1/GtrOC1 family putative glycosyltransferase [Candidatus Omnitrophota bacterium]